MQGHSVVQKGQGRIATIYDASPAKKAVVFGVRTPGSEWTDSTRTTGSEVLDHVKLR